MESLSVLKGMVVTLGLLVAFVAGIDVESHGLPEEFNQAASVGQFTQKQAVSACTTAETELNEQLKQARGTNKFAPAQQISFHCDGADVNPKPATLTPAGP